MRKIGLASVLVFVVWSVLDFVLHGLILQSAYAEQPDLWRPQDEMSMPLIWVVTGGEFDGGAIKVSATERTFINLYEWTRT